MPSGQGQAFFKPSMLDDPWGPLLQRVVLGQQQKQPLPHAAPAGAANLAEMFDDALVGAADPEGAEDRPWH